GVLDGGESEIFLGGTRLTKFMESVDAVTRRDEKPTVAAMPTSEAKPPEDPKNDNPWAPLFTVGLKLLETLAAPPPRKAGGDGGENGSTNISGGWIETDRSTGRSVLKLPLPDPQVLEQLTVALSRLVAGLGG
ncbi:MAG TPA: hypothetical protein VNF49_13020, partial [Candidatus Binataceae bacterium]|nr:hypothetical protein [Candidatus Binataceae bacterium]